MTEQQTQPEFRNVWAVSGLEQFVDRLQPGMELDGRIVEVLGNHIYILRIWGNNILTESNHTFNKLDEVVLSVRAVKPKLVFNLRPIATGNSKGSIYA